MKHKYSLKRSFYGNDMIEIKKLSLNFKDSFFKSNIIGCFLYRSLS